MELRTIILAAGKGTRMKSDCPKVLHPVCGKPIVQYVLDIALGLGSLKTYLVVGFGADQVKAAITADVDYVTQDKPLGTADAVMRCAPYLASYKGNVLILCGDTPLLSKAIVRSLVHAHQRKGAEATFLTAILSNAHGYGRIVRNSGGDLLAIREQKDASFDEDKIKEINVGVYMFKASALFKALKNVKENPAKKEFYLTDVIELLLADGARVETVTTDDETVAFGVNSREHLADATAVIRARVLKEHMANGVTIVDPNTTYIDHDVKIGQDTVIYPCTFIHAGVKIGKNCSIGPFARIRPGSKISDAVEVGNFTEISRSSLGTNTLMKHFSFLGDASIGKNVNIGAGTITANYDGKHKNATKIEDGAFIGSDSVLVAPVTIGRKAVVGAGSVVVKTKVPSSTVVVGAPARVIKKAR